ncbi:MAG TPA: ATP-binding protein [Gemmatimonadales bacterium]|nr:ATP-binding protein [Gemmatimonadales bacterium]
MNRTPLDRRILLLALLVALPALVVAAILLWTGDFASRTRWTVTGLLLVWSLAVAFALRERVIRPLQTLANMLGALREGDFSLRARRANPDDSLGLALYEANLLGDLLRTQRFVALEASALLRTVMSEIDVVVLTFDGEKRLRLINRAGERLLGRPAEQLLGKDAGTLGLSRCLEGETPSLLEAAFASGMGRWEVRRNSFRQGGAEHQLVVLADLSRTLQAEERQAWQRLVRVLSHEINNSLAPIRSIAESLGAILKRSPRPPDVDTDLGEGLEVIAARADALGRFLAAYARLARLPRPVLGPVRVREWVARVAGLEKRHPVTFEPGPDVIVQADGDQLDQLLINLVSNAVDALGKGAGGVTIRWTAERGVLELTVEDDGPGLAQTDNLFVPFFTTKPGGTGIGLALSRQIAEAHGGSLILANREGRTGAVARVRLTFG